MQLVDLFRAHVLGHSSAAMRIGNYDLARTIALKKLDTMQQKQVKLLQRFSFVRLKITHSDSINFIQQWYYQREREKVMGQLDQLESKFSVMLGKYKNIALTAQSFLETRRQGEVRTTTDVLMPTLAEEVGSAYYTHANNCINEIMKVLSYESEIPLALRDRYEADLFYKSKKVPAIYSQSLDTTAKLTNNIMQGMNFAVKAQYYLSMGACDNSATPHHRQHMAELRPIAEDKIDMHVLTMQELAHSVLDLTSKSQRDFSDEVQLVSNIMASLDKLKSLYGNSDAKDISTIRDEILECEDAAQREAIVKPTIGSVNVLTANNMKTIDSAIRYIQDVVIVELRSRSTLAQQAADGAQNSVDNAEER